ncbi:hypothetical protein KAI58_01705 [Candidatus Gracilibacteria bacterium]|nr:hypothetical protein [Candidatus Gracilibacteria bacterium]
MKFIKKKDFETLEKKLLVYNKPTSNPEIAQESDEAKKQAKAEISRALEDLKKTIEVGEKPRDLPIGDQLDMLLFLSKQENLLDDDIDDIFSMENIKNILKRINTKFAPKISRSFRSKTKNLEIGNNGKLYKIISQLSEEALLTFVTNEKTAAFELFTNRDGKNYQVDFFNIDFLDRNVSLLDILPPNQIYIRIGKAFYVRQAKGYVSIHPADANSIARIETGTTLELLDKSPLNNWSTKEVNAFNNLNLNSEKELVEGEKQRTQNFEMYQSMKLLVSSMREKSEDDKKLKIVAESLDAFYIKNKTLSSKEFTKNINDEIELMLNSDPQNLDKFKNLINNFIVKNIEKKQHLISHSDERIESFLDTYCPNKTEEDKNKIITTLLTEVDKEKDFSVDKMKQILAKFSFEFLVKDKVSTARLFTLLKKRHTIIFQNHNNELFVKKIEITLLQSKIDLKKEETQKDENILREQMILFFEKNKIFCISQDIYDAKTLLTLSTDNLETLLVNYKNQTYNDILSNSSPLIQVQLDNDLDTSTRDLFKIISKKKEIVSKTEELSNLEIQKNILQDGLSGWGNRFDQLISKTDVFDKISISIEKGDSFLDKVQEIYKKLKEKKDSSAKTTLSQNENFQTLSVERQEEVNNILWGKQTGLSFVKYGEEGPVFQLGIPKQAIEYNLEKDTFMVIGIDDFNEEYLTFKAEASSIPKMQLFSAMHESNYFNSDTSLSQDGKRLGKLELNMFLNNYFGATADTRILRPDEVNSWYNLGLELRERGIGLSGLLRKLSVLDNNGKLISEKGINIRNTLDELLDAALVNNDEPLNQLLKNSHQNEPIIVS